MALAFSPLVLYTRLIERAPTQNTLRTQMSEEEAFSQYYRPMSRIEPIVERAPAKLQRKEPSIRDDVDGVERCADCGSETFSLDEVTMEQVCDGCGNVEQGIVAGSEIIIGSQSLPVSSGVDDRIKVGTFRGKTTYAVTGEFPLREQSDW